MLQRKLQVSDNSLIVIQIHLLTRALGLVIACNVAAIMTPANSNIGKSMHSISKSPDHFVCKIFLARPAHSYRHVVLRIEDSLWPHCVGESPSLLLPGLVGPSVEPICVPATHT